MSWGTSSTCRVTNCITNHSHRAFCFPFGIDYDRRPTAATFPDREVADRHVIHVRRTSDKPQGTGSIEMTWEFITSILQILIIDVVLSGDNAVVIAMAAHRLPLRQRKLAILC